LKNLKERISGNNINEAEKYIQNLSEIDKVEVKVWPVWSPTIPKLTDNIKIKVVDEIEVEKDVKKIEDKKVKKSKK